MITENPIPKEVVLFDEAKKRMIEEQLYNDPNKLFEWAKEVTGKTIEVESWINGNWVSFKLVSALGELEGSDAIFQNIINYAKTCGIESQVNSPSLSYQAVVVVSMYLDRLGLGYNQNNIING